MFIKQFRSVQVRVPDPLRPGKRAFEDRLIATGGVQIGHGGKTIDADEEGWFEVDHETGTHLLSFRSPDGSRFYTPEQVDEQVRLGALHDDDEELPQARPAKFPKKAAATA